VHKIITDAYVSASTLASPFEQTITKTCEPSKTWIQHCRHDPLSTYLDVQMRTCGSKEWEYEILGAGKAWCTLDHRRTCPIPQTQSFGVFLILDYCFLHPILLASYDVSRCPRVSKELAKPAQLVIRCGDVEETERQSETKHLSEIRAGMQAFEVVQQHRGCLGTRVLRSAVPYRYCVRDVIRIYIQSWQRSHLNPSTNIQP